jgi:hypothetical protein
MQQSQKVSGTKKSKKLLGAIKNMDWKTKFKTASG